ncbi:MAG: hypothetical protein FI727_01800 [SAR202 cluster bacterium]|nr:hypothetical protein [SAR202 cluster bacterium]|tara:strand:- start:880 stop:1839 length:960 start_codon:yes stop_codon:yes gene_type:complete
MINSTEEKLTCSGFSTSVDEPLSGTAPLWRWCVCIEVPLPWNTDVLKSKFFQENALTEELENYSKNIPGLRIQALFSDRNKPQNNIRVLSFKYQNQELVKAEYIFPYPDFKESIRTLINNENIESIEKYKHTKNVRDYLVCTHGNRDMCCGYWGYQLYKQLDTNYSNESIRFWRTSHLGGHRFAPTILSIDDARYWGRLKADDFDRIINKKLQASDISDIYRGKATCESIEEQLVEKELFKIFKWDLENQQFNMSLANNDQSSSQYIVQINDPQIKSKAEDNYLITIEHGKSILRHGCISEPTLRAEKISQVSAFSTIN